VDKSQWRDTREHQGEQAIERRIIEKGLSGPVKQRQREIVITA